MSPSTRCPRDKHTDRLIESQKKPVLGMEVVKEFQSSDQDEHSDHSFRVLGLCHAQWAEEVGVNETVIDGIKKWILAQQSTTALFYQQVPIQVY